MKPRTGGITTIKEAKEEEKNIRESEFTLMTADIDDMRGALNSEKKRLRA